MNITLLFYVKIESKSSAFGIREAWGRREDPFCL